MDILPFKYELQQDQIPQFNQIKFNHCPPVWHFYGHIIDIIDYKYPYLESYKKIWEHLKHFAKSYR